MSAAICFNDEHSCDRCKSRHGRPAATAEGRVDPPFDDCESESGCRCVVVERREPMPPGRLAAIRDRSYGMGNVELVMGLGEVFTVFRKDVPDLLAELGRVNAENLELRARAVAGFDVERVAAWAADPERKASELAFTEGGEREAARLVETAEETLKERILAIANAEYERLGDEPLENAVRVHLTLPTFDIDEAVDAFRHRLEKLRAATAVEPKG